jgi:hypothetical protein
MDVVDAVVNEQQVIVNEQQGNEFPCMQAAHSSSAIEAAFPQFLSVGTLCNIKTFVEAIFTIL